MDRDLIHKFLNISLPLIALAILPPYLIFNFVRCIKRTIFRENVSGKVILITGASSGIGEHLAYEYARRGARLALVARREKRLRVVADKARELGSPDVFVIRADVSKADDCKRLVDETVNHFGHLDHLVNNAGIVHSSLFEEYCTQVSDMAPIMASKAALVSFFETLRTECGSHVDITIVLPGLSESEMTTPDSLSKYDAKFVPPVESTERCAEAIVKSACRGDMYLTEPSWGSVLFLFKLLCPEGFEWFFRWNHNYKGSGKQHKA